MADLSGYISGSCSCIPSSLIHTNIVKIILPVSLLSKHIGIIYQNDLGFSTICDNELGEGTH